MTTAPHMPVDHPGSFIEEELEARGWTKADLAYALGMSPQQLSPILNGAQSISPAMARSFGDAFDMPADFFANLQKMYDLSRAPNADPGVRKRAMWLSTFPVREMITRGWIEDSDPSLLDLQMLRFFGEDRIEDIPFVGNGQMFPHAFRTQTYDEVTPAQYAWIYRVKRVAAQISAPAYSEENLRAALPDVRSHMLSKEDFGDIPYILKDCGVRLVYVEALRGSKIDGVCAWSDAGPIIGMTLRQNRADNFCFVLRHEIEHVLRGDGRAETFVPPDEVTADFLADTNLPEEERLANEAAADFLVPRLRMESFIARKAPYISEKDVLALAASVQMNPSVVVGQIQFRMQRYNWLRKYLKGANDHIVGGWKYTDGWSNPLPTGL